MLESLNEYRDYRIGGQVRRYVAKEPDHLMRVGEVFKKCVAYVLYRDKNGNKALAGTAFFIEFGHLPYYYRKVKFRYTVTARHVIAAINHHSSDGKVILRLNDGTGKAAEVETDFGDWLYPETDTSVDAAVLDWTPSYSTYDYRALPDITTFTKRQNRTLNVGAGDEVFITGLFAHHHGKEKNIPIVRTGNIAMMPEEPVHTKLFGYAEAFLIEARSIGGLSGSPVFVLVPRYDKLEYGEQSMYRPSLEIYWLGLVHGHWDIEVDESSPDAFLMNIPKTERVNVGIAVVVPSEKILEVIAGHSKLVEQRQEQEQAALDGTSPTMDEEEKQ